jgi:hypothetical protein
MSTDHQKYSTQNQQDAIAAYAANRGLTIVCTYKDEGKSGLHIERRDALQRLIDDVKARRTDFEFILVYATEPPRFPALAVRGLAGGRCRLEAAGRLGPPRPKPWR